MSINRVFNSLKQHGLIGYQVVELVNTLSNDDIETCLRNDMLPDNACYCKDFVEAIANRTESISLLYRFVAPRLFYTKLSDIPESKFNYSWCLTDADYTYYLQDSDIYKVSLLMYNSRGRLRLSELLPRLTIDTPRLVDILVHCIYAGVTVTDYTKLLLQPLNHITFNTGILLLYTGNKHMLRDRTVGDPTIVDLSKASVTYCKLFNELQEYKHSATRAIPFMI